MVGAHNGTTNSHRSLHRHKHRAAKALGLSHFLPGTAFPAWVASRISNSVNSRKVLLETDMDIPCISSSRGLRRGLSLLSARASESQKEFTNICKAVARMDGLHYTQRKKCGCVEKKYKLEPAGKTLHDPGTKVTVIFRGHIAEWKESWNRYLILRAFTETGQCYCFFPLKRFRPDK